MTFLGLSAASYIDPLRVAQAVFLAVPPRQDFWAEDIFDLESIDTPVFGPALDLYCEGLDAENAEMIANAKYRLAVAILSDSGETWSRKIRKLKPETKAPPAPSSNLAPVVLLEDRLIRSAVQCLQTALHQKQNGDLLEAEQPFFDAAIKWSQCSQLNLQADQLDKAMTGLFFVYQCIEEAAGCRVAMLNRTGQEIEDSQGLKEEDARIWSEGLSEVSDAYGSLLEDSRFVGVFPSTLARIREKLDAIARMRERLQKMKF